MTPGHNGKILERKLWRVFMCETVLYVALLTIGIRHVTKQIKFSWIKTSLNIERAFDIRAGFGEWEAPNELGKWLVSMQVS